jgi:hypothetical protein
MFTVGLVVNPKSGELAEVAYDQDDERISTHDLDGEKLGEGYYEGDSDSDSALPQKYTGLPRANTPEGVKERGGGWGTVLYTAMCLGAYLESRGVVRVDLTVSGPGISSGDWSRSSSATKWWYNAVEEYGLASNVEGCNTTSDEDSFSDSGRGDDYGLESSIESSTDRTVTKVIQYSVSADYEYEEEVCGEAQAYPYKNAIRKNLIVAEATSEKLSRNVPFFELTRAEMLEHLNVISLDVILALNVGYLRAQANGIDSFFRILDLAEQAGATKKQTDWMKRRYNAAADVQLDLRKWMHGRGQGAWPTEEAPPEQDTFGFARVPVPEDDTKPPTPNGRRRPFATTRLVLPNRGHRRVGLFQRNPTNLRLTGEAGITPVFYGPGARQNPESEALIEDLEELQQRRVNLGWDSFALED